MFSFVNWNIICHCQDKQSPCQLKQTLRRLYLNFLQGYNFKWWVSWCWRQSFVRHILERKKRRSSLISCLKSTIASKILLFVFHSIHKHSWQYETVTMKWKIVFGIFFFHIKTILQNCQMQNSFLFGTNKWSNCMT